MSTFFDNSITDGGRQLWAEMQAGGAFVPTRIVVGSGYLPAGKTTRTVTAVAEPVKDIEINKKEKMNEGDFVIGGVFTNADITTAFYYRELALYAKVTRTDGTETAETLYSYGNAGASAELIPAYSTDTAIERQLDLLVYIGNDATIKIEVSTGVYVTRDVYDDDIGAIKRSINNKIVAYENVLVPAASFASDTTYTGYPYKADITCEGLTTDYIADVVFSPADAARGILAPVAAVGTGIVTIYARELPDTAVSILTIECRRVNDNYDGGGGEITDEDVASDEEVQDVIDDIFDNTGESEVTEEDVASDDEVQDVIDSIFK